MRNNNIYYTSQSHGNGAPGMTGLCGVAGLHAAWRSNGCLHTGMEVIMGSEHSSITLVKIQMILTILTRRSPPSPLPAQRKVKESAGPLYSPPHTHTVSQSFCLHASPCLHPSSSKHPFPAHPTMTSAVVTATAPRSITVTPAGLSLMQMHFYY